MSSWALWQRLLFCLDPERAHALTLALAKPFNSAWTSKLASHLLGTANLRQTKSRTCFGVNFPNPIGIAAGLDKNAEAVGLLAALGVGAIELGSVTAVPQSGNERPRMFRLEQHRALVNRLGFPSIGAAALAERLKVVRQSFPALTLGINIGKSKIAAPEEAPQDYRTSFELVAPFADYVVVNVSSPNTPGLRDLQQRDALVSIFSELKRANTANKPILVKLSPDMTQEQLEDAVGAALDAGARGVIATNTTLSRPDGTDAVALPGGLSGRPLFALALENVKRVVRLVDGRVPIVAVGGIDSRERCREMLNAGASLVQLYSALVFRGPRLIRELLHDLASH